MEWTYLIKDKKVIGKHNLSQERLEKYLELGYKVCEEDDCDCSNNLGSDTTCEPKPKRKPKPKSKKAKK